MFNTPTRVHARGPRVLGFAFIAFITLAAATGPTAAADSPPRDPAVDDHTASDITPEVLTASEGTQYIVQVEDAAALDAVVADIESDGDTVGNTLDGAVTALTTTLDADAAAELRARDGVVAVQPDRMVQLSAVQNDATWGLDRIDQRNLPLNGRYSYRNAGTGVEVYVIDSGINLSHVDFTGRIRPGWFIDFGDGTGVTDCNGHGTHVSGTVGGTKWGVAKGVFIRPVKVFPCTGGVPTSYVVSAANWVVANHAAGVPAVANMSLGGGANSIMDSAVQAMVNDGVTVVVSAGNSTDNSCNYSPARVPTAITVAASDITDNRAWFSNYGSCNDLFAPGVDIESADAFSNTGSVSFNGTSMASPHVAGAAAQILQRSPAATPAQVWAAMNADTTRGAISECCGEPDKLLHVLPHATAGPPSAPRGLRGIVAPAGGVRSGQVKLTWGVPTTTVAAVTDYVVQRVAPGGAWVTVRDGVSGARSTLVRGLRNGTTYRFRVAAKNAAGQGAFSAQVRATPRWKPTKPRALRATVAPARGVGSGQVRLTWSAPGSVNGAAVKDYLIQRRSGARWVTVRDGVSKTRATTVRGLRNGTTYRFRVAAKNAAGWSQWSGIVRATPQG